MKNDSGVYWIYAKIYLNEYTNKCKFAENFPFSVS